LTQAKLLRKMSSIMQVGQFTNYILKVVEWKLKNKTLEPVEISL